MFAVEAWGKNPKMNLGAVVGCSNPNVTKTKK